VYPQALEFLIGYGKQFQPMIPIGIHGPVSDHHHRDGVIFELPILVFFLSLWGLSAGWIVAQSRYSILVIFIICSHPYATTDILTWCIFAAQWWRCMCSVLRSHGSYIPTGRARSEKKKPESPQKGTVFVS